jgi:hypothetical protein
MSSMIDEIESVRIGDLGERNGRKLSETPAAMAARERRAAINAGTIPAPKARAGARRPRGAPRTPRTPRTLYPEIAAFLTMTNTLVTMTPLGSKYEATGTFTPFPVGPGLSIPMPDMAMVKLGDELDEMEIAQLAKAIDAQAQRSPRFKKYVEMALGLGAGFGILSILGLIVGRRAARHGLIDPSLDPKLGAMLNGDISSLAAFVPTPQADETPHPDTGEVAPIPDDDSPEPFRFDG